MNYELGFVNKKYRKWLCILGSFLLCLVYGSITTLSNMSPYIISYLRECNKEVEIRYSTAVWMPLANVGSLKIISLLTGFIFALKFNINMKLYIFFGCFIFRFVVLYLTLGLILI